MKSVDETIRDNLKLIESMAESDSTDKEIAEKLDISYSSFKRHKSQNSELKGHRLLVRGIIRDMLP